MTISTKASLIQDLRQLLSQLGERGGLMTPSLYNTARCLRFAPPANPAPALAWLLDAQQDDGGWGAPVFPLARDVPTLAVLVALVPYRDDHPQCDMAIECGIAFLKRHAGIWLQPLPDDIPVAVELILPQLVDEALALGLDVPAADYVLVRQLGDGRRHLIQAMQPGAGTAPAHAWECWGRAADPAMIDGSGGVGHSPAATALWLHLARSSGADVEPDKLAAAEQYLWEAAAATGHDPAAGIVPTVWPIPRFEQSWALYALMVTDMLDHSVLASAIRPQLNSLAAGLKPRGIGMSDHFMADGDCTSATVAILAAAGYLVKDGLVEQYQRGQEFFTYPFELQPSITTTAHCVLALAMLGQDVSASAEFLAKRQAPDGRWTVDKWHCSWLYTTSQVLVALVYAGEVQSVQAGVAALLRSQQPDGGWGINGSTPAETAYAAQALYCAYKTRRSERIKTALQDALRFLLAQHGHSAKRNGTLWIDKELYAPHRVDLAFELTAMLALVCLFEFETQAHDHTMLKHKQLNAS